MAAGAMAAARADGGGGHHRPPRGRGGDRGEAGGPRLRGDQRRRRHPRAPEPFPGGRGACGTRPTQVALEMLRRGPARPPPL